MKNLTANQLPVWNIGQAATMSYRLANAQRQTSTEENESYWFRASLTVACLRRRRNKPRAPGSASPSQPSARELGPPPRPRAPASWRGGQCQGNTMTSSTHDNNKSAACHVFWLTTRLNSPGYVTAVKPVAQREIKQKQKTVWNCFSFIRIFFNTRGINTLMRLKQS